MLTQDEYNALVILLQRLALTQVELVAVGVILAKVVPQAPAAPDPVSGDNLPGGTA